MRLLQAIRKMGILYVCCRALVAYLDPGSGSLIVQVLIAVVVGALATLRFWKARLLNLLGIRQEDDEEDADTEALPHGD